MSGPVVIVGAGVVGLCAAEALIREGRAVIVVERSAETRDGPSFGNAGLIVPSHFVPLAAPGVLGQGLRWMLDPESPFYVQPRLDLDLLGWGWRFLRSATTRHVERASPVLRDLHLASRRLHHELAARLPTAPAVASRGLMMICATAAGLEDETKAAERAIALGLRADVLSSPEASDRLGLQVSATGAVHVLDDAHTSPRGLMEALQRGVASAGGRFVWERAVTSFERAGRRVVGLRLSDGELLRTETVVIAAGAASSTLGRGLGLRWPLQSGRGYSVTVTDPPTRPSVPAILSEARVAVTPLPEGVRFGGTMEIASDHRPVDLRRVRGIARAVERYLPAYRADDIVALPVWHGARPVTPDGMPYLGRPRRYDNVVVATGHGMMGFSLGPVTGAIVADLVQRRQPTLASALLDPDRYTPRWPS